MEISEKSMDKEKLGGLIDAIYAIAMTLLVLELPRPESTTGIGELIRESSNFLIDYGLAFIILFAFWYNQRRINDLVVRHQHATLWINGLSLMMVCILPFATALLYNFGQRTSWIGEFNLEAVVDIVFVTVCLSIDGLIHLNLAIINRTRSYSQEHYQKVFQIMHSRRIATIVLILSLLISFALPVPNRVSLIVVPILLIFETEIADKVSQVWTWLHKKK